MKQIFLSFFAVVWLSCGSTDQPSGAAAEVAAGADPTVAGTHTVAAIDSASFTSIQWIDSVYQDIGKVKEGVVAEVSWRLKNAGNKPLIIQNVAPGCGCTVADKPEEPIAPGGESVIKAKFNSSGQHAGEHRKYLAVMANTKDGMQHQLQFRAEVVE